MTWRRVKLEFTLWYGVPKDTSITQLQKQFGSNLRRERMRHELTQARLAEHAGLDIRVLQKFEAGESNVLMTTVVRLRRAIGCDWDSLMPK